jgi:phosphohistidine swiveling domain-containing protein
MIELTEEMIQAFEQAAGRPVGRDSLAGLTAFAAVIEREVIPAVYGMGRDDEADDVSMVVTLDEINARRGGPW